MTRNDNTGHPCLVPGMSRPETLFMSIDWRASLVSGFLLRISSLDQDQDLVVGSGSRRWISAEDDRSALWVSIWFGLGIFLENVVAIDCVVRNSRPLL